jgi:hypothetical protein
MSSPSSDRPETTSTAEQKAQAKLTGGGASPAFQRACAGYDQAFREHLTAQLISTIARESHIADANVMALRVGETCDALLDLVCTMLALSPAMSTPSKLRNAAEQFAKRIRKDVSAARAAGVADTLGGSQFSGLA